MEERFHWCFIGSGRLAGQIAQQIAESEKHDIVSVYSRRMESAQAFADKYGTMAYETPEEAICAENVDAVYIVTPHSSHYEYMKLALKLGKPVLCEKAFTTDASQAKEVFEIAQKQKLYLVEAMWTWFSPIALQVKKWVDEGEFGTITEVHANYCCNGWKLGGRLTDPNAAGGTLLDIGVYPITYMYRLFGKPESIICKGEIIDGADSYNEIEMNYSNGFKATCTASLAYGEKGENLRIIGTEATMMCENFHYCNSVSITKNDGTVLKLDGMTKHIQEFDIAADEIRAGKLSSDYVKPEYTLDVMELMDDCRKQMDLVYPFEK